MKKLCFLACTVALASFLAACGDDEPSGPTPVVEFTQDRNFSEPGGAVTFTNTSTDAVEYFWEFGDGGISTDENPTHTYLETGNYTITLQARGSGGIESSTTSTIVVGSRFVTAIDFIKIGNTDADGNPWDDDGTGPDLIFWIDETSNNTNPRFFTVIEDLEQTDLTIRGTFDPEGQFALTNQDWSFLLIDNDEPLDELSLGADGDDIMLALGGNPTTFGTADYQSGQGLLKLESLDQSIEIDVIFQIRN